jgi:hypothetical protein
VCRQVQRRKVESARDGNGEGGAGRVGRLVRTHDNTGISTVNERVARSEQVVGE